MSGIAGRAAAVCLLMAAVPCASRAAGPAPETVQAFNRYVRMTEMRLDSRLRSEGDFLWADSPERRLRLRNAAVACEPRNRQAVIRVPRGLVHHWVGAVFIPAAGVQQVLAVVQDYGNHKATYWPEVVASEIVSRNGLDFRVRLRLMKRKASVTVLLDTEHDVHYERIGQRCWRSRSHSTRVVEVDPRSGKQAPKDRGFLWKLNSYWTFHELDGGTYVECEAISLTRGVPRPFAWLLNPVIRTLPREALSSTLSATRNALRTKPAALIDRQGQTRATP